MAASTATSDRLLTPLRLQQLAGVAADRLRAATRSGSAIIATPTAAGHDPLLLEVAAGERAHLAALAHHHDPVAHRQHLGQVGRDEDDGDAGAGELADQLMDIGLGADIDAAGRLVEDAAPPASCPATWRASPSAGCRRRGRRPGWPAMASGSADRLGRPRPPAARPRRSTSRQRLTGTCAGRGREMFAATDCGKREAEPAPVLGDVGDAVGDRPTGRTDLHLDAVAPDRSPASAGRTTEQRLGDLRAARADETGEAEHLALAHLERDVLEGARRPSPSTLRATSPGSWAHAPEEVGRAHARPCRGSA